MDLFENLQKFQEQDLARFGLQKDRQGYRLFMSDSSSYIKQFRSELHSDKDYKEFPNETEAEEFVNEFGEKYNVDTKIEMR